MKITGINCVRVPDMMALAQHHQSDITVKAVSWHFLGYKSDAAIYAEFALIRG